MAIPKSFAKFERMYNLYPPKGTNPFNFNIPLEGEFFPAASGEYMPKEHFAQDMANRGGQFSPAPMPYQAYEPRDDLKPRRPKPY